MPIWLISMLCAAAGNICGLILPRVEHAYSEPHAAGKRCPPP
jgi:hypothetical protein